MRGQVALVTGASSGLGIALAEALAERGYDLVLTARSAAPMNALAERLRASAGIGVTVETADLSQPAGARDLIARLDARGLDVAVLINNAGFGMNGPFTGHDPDRLAAMLQLNIGSLSELSRHYGARMAAAGRGHILLVASVAAFQPDPLLAAYGASKAYVLSLGEALHVELAPRVGVTVLVPGIMETSFAATADFEVTAMVRRTAVSPARVARIGLAALFAGRPSVIAGAANRAMVFVSRLAPRMFAARQSYKAAGGGSRFRTR